MGLEVFCKGLKLIYCVDYDQSEGFEGMRRSFSIVYEIS